MALRAAAMCCPSPRLRQLPVCDGPRPDSYASEFSRNAKNVVLENHLRTDETRRYRLHATGEDPGDALGNQTDTTEDERARLGQWLKELPRTAR